MLPDQFDFRDQRNPYAAPAWNSRPIRSGVVKGVRPEPGRVFRLDHDLSERDLRRFVNFDMIYDPLPFLGFLPQWTYVYLLMFLFGATVSRFLWRSTELAIGLGAAWAIFVFHSARERMAANRREAMQKGLCQGRHLTISAEGLRVVIDSGAETSLPGIGEMRSPWTDFRRVEFLGEYLILWMEGRKRLVVPIQAFKSPEDAEQFAEAAAGWIDLAANEPAEVP